MIIHICPNIGWISGKGMNEIKKIIIIIKIKTCEE